MHQHRTHTTPTPHADASARTTPPGTRIGRRPFTLLGVWAHPDDETYLSAALMHRVVRTGGRVVLICATRGERGSDDPNVDRRHLGSVRERELRTAMEHLGVHDVRVLGHPDGECAEVDDRAVVSTLTTAMQSLQPDLVVTFGPDGITNHPDHRTVSRWTTHAWLAAGGRRHRQLLYATMTQAFVDRHRREYSDLPLTVEGAPFAVTSDEVALRIVPSPEERARKRAALASHESQIGGLVRLVGENRLHDWWLVETFREPTHEEVADRSPLSAPSRVPVAV